MNKVVLRTSLDEPRLIREVGLEAKIGTIVESVILPLGFRLVRVHLSCLNRLTVQIMVEQDDGQLTIEDCQFVSQMLSPIFDVKNFIDRHYDLEISSPGVDRPLVRYSDFINHQGFAVQVTARKSINGQKKFIGSLVEIDGKGFLLRIKEGKNISFSFADLAGVRLILTDILLQEILAKKKIL